MAGLRGEVVYLFAFDVGNEMLTARVESQLARRASPLQIRRPQLAPPAVSFYRPLAVELPPAIGAVCGLPAQTEIRVYDVGCVTVAIRVGVAVGGVGELRRFHRPQTDAGEPLSAAARTLCDRVRAELGDAVRGPAQLPAPEAYTVFCLTDLGGEADAAYWLAGQQAEVAALLTDLDPAAISDGQVAETVRNARALEASDLVVIDWDAALVVDLAGPPAEVLYVLELANLQLLEWRVLDAVLDGHLARLYERAGRRPGLWGGGWGAALLEVRQLRVDVAKLADEVTNITKFVGDWYLARVYLTARERFHLDIWRASVDQRLGQLDRLYGVIQGDVNARRMLWLEVSVVTLILVELLVALAARW
jgi:hypothetical protein